MDRQSVMAPLSANVDVQGPTIPDTGRPATSDASSKAKTTLIIAIVIPVVIVVAIIIGVIIFRINKRPVEKSESGTAFRLLV
jgi:hypothetical protein